MVSEPMTPEVLTPLRTALAAPHSPPRPAPRPGVAAAVLVPLFERDGELHLLYTTRSATLPQHAGQVAFPGGRHAPGADADPARDGAPRNRGRDRRRRRRHRRPRRARPDPHLQLELSDHPVRRTDSASVSVSSRIRARCTTSSPSRSPCSTIPPTSWRKPGRSTGARCRSCPIVTTDAPIWGATQRITATLLDLLTAIRAHQD